jgi:hypothetical protein
MTVVISGLKPTIKCPASLHIPTDDGTFHVHKFDVIFKRQSKEQRDALQKRFTAGEITGPQMLDELVEGWGGMLDAQGQPVAYSHAERRATEQQFPGIEEAMAVAWFDMAFMHQRVAAEKNSKAQSVTSTASTAQAVTS